MIKPQISVVIPLYNKSNHILDALSSVFSQTSLPLEVIIVDDGSTDDSLCKVKQLKSPLITLITQTNQGVSSARNVGVKAAVGDYIAFLDADDLWLPFFLETIESLILSFPSASLYATSYQKFMSTTNSVDAKIKLTIQSPSGFIMDDYFDVASHGDLPFMISSCVVKRIDFNEIGGFPEDENMGEDQSLFCTLAIEREIAYSPRILMHYALASDNKACDTIIPSSLCPFAEKLLNYVEHVQPSNKRNIERFCAAHVYELALRNIKHKRPEVARRLIKHPIIKHKPLHYFRLRLQLLLTHVL